MKQTKRILSIVLAMVMLALSMPMAYGAEIVDSGTCGDNITWTLDSEGLLTISGTGKMRNYSESKANPFYGKSNIKSVVS